jgi:hypothetical protein
MRENPFIPAFGEVPPSLVGRFTAVEYIDRALKKEGGDPYKSVLFTGARGSGKTVMLREIEDIGLKYGYISVYANAGDDLTRTVLDRLEAKAANLLNKKSRKISSVNLGNAGVSFEPESLDPKGFLTRLEEVVMSLNEKGAGVLFLIDEVSPTSEGLAQLVSTYQIFRGEGKKVALMLAGLPEQVSELLSGKDDVKHLSFLRRAERVFLDNIDIFEVKKSFEKVISDNGRTASDKVLDIMAKATKGYSFMIQLIGYYTWDANLESDEIVMADVDRGILEANDRLEKLVFVSSVFGLSVKDRVVLSAISENLDPSTITQIAGILGVTNAYVTQYKNRLLESGLITIDEFGRMDFAMPYLREYIHNKIAPKYLGTMQNAK